MTPERVKRVKSDVLGNRKKEVHIFTLFFKGIGEWDQSHFNSFAICGLPPGVT